MHVPAGMLHHQHFNPTDEVTRELRFEFGIRCWFADQWNGYLTVGRDLQHAPLHDDECAGGTPADLSGVRGFSTDAETPGPSHGRSFDLTPAYTPGRRS